MKSSKERKMDRKRKHKALAVAKTEKSRQRRLDNKAKRAEIHAINPDAKITINNGITYINGIKVEIINGAIKSHYNKAPLINEPLIDIFDETVEVFDTETEEVEAVEVDNVGRFQTLVNKWRK